MKFKDFDFAPGDKTVSGIVLLILPMIASRFGWDTDVTELKIWLSDIALWVGSAVVLYGMTCKKIRNIKKIFNKK